jgi:LacI family transcriptional regulator
LTRVAVRAPRKLQGKARIEDVAAAAGVSPATVSRVFNSPGLVRPEIRVRVQRLSEEMGYLANGAARALASRRSWALGAVIPTLNNTIFAGAIDAFQTRLEAGGYVMLVTSSNYDADREYQQVRVMHGRGVEGLMLVGAAHEPRVFKLLEASGLPFVQVWARRGVNAHPCIGYDNAAPADLVIDHLVGLGHTDIALVVGGMALNDRVAGRIAGVERAMARHGLRLPLERVVQRPYSIEDGREGLRQLLRHEPWPTAIVAGNDVLAFGLLREALERGMSVPRDLSITGIGDLDLASQLLPPLTTVRTPRDQMGHLAAEFLMQAAEGKRMELPPELPVQLIVRGTTAPPGRRAGPMVEPPARPKRAAKANKG